MKALLPAIRNALKTISQLSAATDCYITPDDRWRPENIGNTAISIRPVRREPEELGGNALDIRATVVVSCFMPQSADGETALCGTTGLYDFADDIQAILTDNGLSLSGFESVEVGPDGETAVRPELGEPLLVQLPRQYIYTMIREG